jgi:hypothetical protein
MCIAYAHKNFVDDNPSHICYIIFIITSKNFVLELTKISRRCCYVIQESNGIDDPQMQPHMKLW